MKKRLVAFATIGILLLSCSTTSEDYTIVAKELCKCMEENGNEGGDDPLVKVNLGVCLLESSVDLKNPQMIEALKAECPDIKDAFSEYVKGM